MFETMKAAIFDMDGTLIDSMTRWREMNGAFVRQMGIIPTEKQEADMMSMSGTMVVDYFKNEFGLETNFDALCVKACEAMEPVYSAGVPHKPGAAAYLKRLRARGVKQRARRADDCFASAVFASGMVIQQYAAHRRIPHFFRVSFSRTRSRMYACGKYPPATAL